MRFLGLSGSLRAGSYSTAVLRSIVEIAAGRAEVEVLWLGDVPLYNEDLNRDPLPGPVAELKRAIGEADGLILVSPEYNYGMSGVMKNAIDWASRPAYRSPFVGKPVLIVTQSPASTGGVRAQEGLSYAMLGVLARVLPRPQVVIGNSGQKIEDGRLTDEKTRGFVSEAIDDLIAEARRLREAA